MTIQQCHANARGQTELAHVLAVAILPRDGRAGDRTMSRGASRQESQRDLGEEASKSQTEISLLYACCTSLYLWDTVFAIMGTCTLAFDNAKPIHLAYANM